MFSFLAQSPTVLTLHIPETVNHQSASIAETHEKVSSFALHFQMQWRFLFVLASSFLRKALCVDDSRSSLVGFTVSRFLHCLHISSVSKLVRSSLITQTRHPDR